MGILSNVCNQDYLLTMCLLSKQKCVFFNNKNIFYIFMILSCKLDNDLFQTIFCNTKVAKSEFSMYYKSIAEKLMGERRKILHILVHHAQLDTYVHCCQIFREMSF